MEAQGYSVKNLAAAVGMSANGVSEILAGRNITQWAKLVRFCEVLGVTPDTLLGFAAEPAPDAFELFRDGMEAILIDLGWPPDQAADTVGIAADTACARVIVGQDRRLENRAVAVALARNIQRQARKS